MIQMKGIRLVALLCFRGMKHVLDYNDENNPRIQLEPIGTRGYIELVPVMLI